MKLVHRLSIPFIILLLGSCASLRNPYSNIQDDRAKLIIEQSIRAYGGLENWKNINYLSFDKWYALYDENGNEEVNVNQEHHYTPQKIYMTWTSGEDKFEQSKIGAQYKKLKNGEADPKAKLQPVKNSILAATFVMNFPYNLLEKGSVISYDGEITFMGKTVYVIKAEYFPETQRHHTTKDIWWHYIDQESYISLGYKVKHLDHVSLVKNTSFHTVKGFTLPWKRESFRIDENGEELFLRAEYEYSEYSVLN